MVIALHEAGGSVEEGRDRGLRPDMEFQLSPLTQMLGWNRQSVSILATPSRTLKMQLLARTQDLSLCISPCISSTWARVPLFLNENRFKLVTLVAKLVTLVTKLVTLVAKLITLYHPIQGPGPENILGSPYPPAEKAAFDARRRIRGPPHRPALLGCTFDNRFT